MKKGLSFVLVLVLLLSWCAAVVSADGLSTAQRVSQAIAEKEKESTPTEARILTAFCQLAVKRMEQFEEMTEIDIDYLIGNETIKPVGANDLLECSFAFGTIFANKNDYTVESVLMLLVDGDSTEDETTINLYKCIAAMSALEYSDQDDALMNIIGNLDPESDSSAIAKTYKIFGESIITNTLQLLREPSYNLGEEVKVYTGNYSYYAEGRNIDGSEVIFLIAKKR